MSRSTRKPFGYVIPSRMQKMWKKMANKAVRNTSDMPNGKAYKKIEDTWTSPADGPKKYLGINDKKLLRK